MADTPLEPERPFDIQMTAEVMAGHYTNFAKVSASDYEFTLTFARVDHDAESPVIPGVVVSRINLSPRLMRELIDAMEDSYGRWFAHEGINTLPEVEERDDF